MLLWKPNLILAVSIGIFLWCVSVGSGWWIGSLLVMVVFGGFWIISMQLKKINKSLPVDKLFFGKLPHLQSPKDLTHEFRGKRVLIVGGTRGVGLGCAINLIQAGAELMIVGRSKQSGVHALKVLSSLRVYEYQEIRYISADLSLISSTNEFINIISKQDIRYDYMIMTIGVFPNWKEYYTSDHIEKMHATMIFARFFLLNEMHRFMKNGCIVVNVLAHGIALNPKIERGYLTGDLRLPSLFVGLQSIALWSELLCRMFCKLHDSSEEFQFYLIGTHPGMLKSQLHDNQGFFVSLFLDKIVAGIFGRSKEKSGRYIMNSLLKSNNFIDKNEDIFIVIDQNRIVRKPNKCVRELEKKHGEWLWNYLRSKTNLEEKKHPN